MLMGTIRDWFRRKVTDKAGYEKRQRYIKTDREMRELRAERRGMKWIGQKAQRWDKADPEVRDAKAQALKEIHERRVALEEAGHLDAPITPELVDEMNGMEAPTTDDLADVAKGVAAARANEAKAELYEKIRNSEHGPIVKIDLIPKVDADQALVEQKGLSGLVKRMLKKKEFDVTTIRHRSMTPAERGGFTPTPREYAKEIIPAYVETDEELERWRELKKAEDAFAEACEARDARPGVAACHAIGESTKGHAWWKVPRQPRWECVECGLNLATNIFDLRRGVLVNIQRGAINRHVLSGMEKLVQGDNRFLLTSQGEPKKVAQIRKEVEILREQGVMGLPDIPSGWDGNQSTMAPMTKYEEQENAYHVCTNCGQAKLSHRSEDVPVFSGKHEGVTQVLWCRERGVDAT